MAIATAKAPKAAKTEKAPKTVGGLTPIQAGILVALNKGPTPKKELPGASSRILGAATKDNGGAQGGGMMGVGFIRTCEAQAEGRGRVWFQITSAGRKALEKFNKASK